MTISSKIVREFLFSHADKSVTLSLVFTSFYYGSVLKHFFSSWTLFIDNCCLAMTQLLFFGTISQNNLVSLQPCIWYSKMYLYWYDTHSNEVHYSPSLRLSSLLYISLNFFVPVVFRISHTKDISILTIECITMYHFICC